MRTEFLCVSVLRVTSGLRVKLAICKSALNPRWFTLLTFLGGGPGVSLTLRCFVVYSTRRFVVCLSVCHFVLVFFSPFSIAITSLGEERANLSAFRTFVRYVLVWICRFPLPLGVWEGLRFVIVALPGLFSYLFFCRSKLAKIILMGNPAGMLKIYFELFYPEPNRQLTQTLFEISRWLFQTQSCWCLL